MKRIAFVIPFYYKWNNYSNVKANYEYLLKMGYEVDVYSKSDVYTEKINWEWYDIVMLHGSGAVLPEEEYKKVKCAIISFGWSDPNLFNDIHYKQGTVYCTNDLNLAMRIDTKPSYFYNTACDKRHHVDLYLEKETDILVYGCGNHKFVPERNKTVSDLRLYGYKIKVFGKGWIPHEDTFGFIEGEELAREICKAHIVLDITNGSTAWGHRIFESSARGTPVLTFDRKDTRSMFKEWDEILLYKDFVDLVIKLSIAMMHKNDLRKIGLRAQQRCYKDHDISVRIKKLIKIMDKL